MSVTVDHYLHATGLKQMLLDAGIVAPQVLYGEPYSTVLDKSKCCPEKWEEDKARAIAHGILQLSKIDPETGELGLRRDLTPEEVEALPFFPIMFHTDDEIAWFSKWVECESVAFYISKKFPEVELTYEAISEDKYLGKWVIKDGVFERIKEASPDDDCDDDEDPFGYDDAASSHACDEGNAFNPRLPF
jgi:hypothetical protein